VVAAPVTTVDLATASGTDIEVEQRDPAEVTAYAGQPVAPAGSPAYNPAFDVTPAELVTAIVTDRGVATADAAGGIAAALVRLIPDPVTVVRPSVP
jgi:methylthioribose-1-phosphate isomerase